MGQRLKKPPYTHGFIDRHGRARYYFRRPGFKPVALPGLPWCPEFMGAYEVAMKGESAPKIEIGASRTVPGTVNAIVSAYLDCSADSTSPFKTLAAETQRTRRNILENFRERHGTKRIFYTDHHGKRVPLLAREHMQRIVNEKIATPFAQRNLLNTLRAMFSWAVDEGRVPDDPSLGVKRKKTKTTGYRTWSEAEIERFENKYPITTKARLAFALLLYTGQRRSDVVKMGRQHIHKGVLTIDQRKTEGGEESHLEIPVHPKLKEVIDATPSGHLTFLVTSFGKPYTSNGFGNKMRDGAMPLDAPMSPRMACAKHALAGLPRLVARLTKSHR